MTFGKWFDYPECICIDTSSRTCPRKQQDSVSPKNLRKIFEGPALVKVEFYSKLIHAELLFLDIIEKS